MKYLGWLIVGVLVGAALMWLWDHQDLLANRDKISGVNKILEGWGQL